MLTSLNDSVAKLDILLKTNLQSIPLSARAEIGIHLTSIRRHADGVLASGNSRDEASGIARDAAASTPDPSSSPAPVPIHRYLGEASDVRFFNLVKGILLEKHGRQLPEGDLDSYEQDDISPQNRAVSISLELPSPTLADEYIDTYFSTIHIAYPFVPRSSFLRTYAKARDSGLATGLATSWLAILCRFSPGLGGAASLGIVV